MHQGTIHDRWTRGAGILLVLLFALSWSLQRPGPCNEAVDGLHTQGKVEVSPCLFLTESKHVGRKLSTEIREVSSMNTVAVRPPAPSLERGSFPLTWKISLPGTPELVTRSWRAPPSSSTHSA